MAGPYLGNAKNTMDVIRRYDFAFQKRFGQNFLIDENILKKIVGCAEISGDDCVLEIGPGIGTLTQYLVRCAGPLKSRCLPHTDATKWIAGKTFFMLTSRKGMAANGKSRLPPYLRLLLRESRSEQRRKDLFRHRKGLK